MQDDQAGLLVALATLPQHPESVPINLLVRVAGTKLADGEAVDPITFVRIIAAARIIMPRSFVRLAAGREDMSDETHALCFLAGVNSIFYGAQPADHAECCGEPGRCVAGPAGHGGDADLIGRALWLPHRRMAGTGTSPAWTISGCPTPR